MKCKKVIIICKSFIELVFFLLMFWNMVGVLFLNDHIQYYAKKDMIINNIIASIIGITVFICVRVMYIKIPVSLRGKAALYIDKIILCFSVLGFFIQVYMVYNYYFMTDWDAGIHVLPNVERIANGTPELLPNSYFSQFTNNLLIVFVFSVIRRFDIAFGILDTTVGLMGLITFQCMICMVTGWLIYKTANMITCRKSSAVGAWLIYVVLIGLSPWFSIPYSDATGLFFPTMILYIYVCEKKQKKTHIRNWILIAILSIWGYKIKPQTIIIFIAILITECFEMFLLGKPKYMPYFKNAIAVLFGIIITLSVSNVCISTLNFQLDSELAFGWEHFAMIGLNEEHNGGYITEDVLYSGSFLTKKERKKASLETIHKRLKGFGIGGLAKHLTKKSLTNFGDGTFAWGTEGTFFYEMYEDKNHFMSPLLKSIYYTNGKNYHIWEAIEQSCWMFVLIGIMMLLLNVCESEKIFLLILSLLGLIIFNLIFEARARYLFTYSPVFIIVSVIGWNNFIGIFHSNRK